MKHYFFILVFFLTLQGCTDNYEDIMMPCPQTPGQELDTEGSDISGEWHYKGFFKGGNFNPAPFQDEHYYFFRMKLNDTVSGRAEHHLTGEYEIFMSGSIRFDVHTIFRLVLRAYPWWCDHMVDALNNAQCYELDKNENKLHITSANEDGEKIIMKFRRIEN